MTDIETNFRLFSFQLEPRILLPNSPFSFSFIFKILRPKEQIIQADTEMTQIALRSSHNK